MMRASGLGGLSALAALALVLYAVDPALLPGGFAGVDVLFVVAGYLAAREIEGATKGGAFALGGYYARLLRWTAPAMLAMLASISILIWAIWPANGHSDYSLTLAASAIFAANFVFAAIADFFDPVARAQPLLHLWALGVAAQVLLVLPLVYLAVIRLAPSRLQLALIVLTIVSYWSGVWGEATVSERAWYMPHMRAWELLFGVLLVFGDLPDLTSRIRRAVLALTGLAIIGASVFLLDGGMRLPGVATIPPALGAGLVIYAGVGGENPVSRWLDAWPLSIVGGAGLSIYLWHWPVLVLTREVSSGGVATLVALIVVAVAATLSYRFLEQPFREQGRSPDRRAVALAVLGMAALFAVATLGVMA